MKNKFNYNNFDFENSKDLDDFLKLEEFHKAFSSSMGSKSSNFKIKPSKKPISALREVLVTRKFKAFGAGDYELYDALDLLINQYDLGIIGFKWDPLNQSVKVEYFDKN